MGKMVSVTDMGKDNVGVDNQVCGRVKAGMGMATVGAKAGFAAGTGTSVASAAVFTKVAVPEMLRLGYKPTDWLELALVGQNLTDARHHEFNDVQQGQATQVPRSGYLKATLTF